MTAARVVTEVLVQGVPPVGLVTAGFLAVMGVGSLVLAAAGLLGWGRR